MKRQEKPSGTDCQAAWPTPHGGQVLLAQRGEVDVELRVVRVGLDAEFVGAVLAEPVDVFGQVRRDARQVFRVDLPSLLKELAHDLRDVQGVVEDHRFSELRDRRRGSGVNSQPRSGQVLASFYPSEKLIPYWARLQVVDEPVQMGRQVLVPP